MRPFAAQAAPSEKDTVVFRLKVECKRPITPSDCLWQITCAAHR
jgi:hypothetical protein